MTNTSKPVVTLTLAGTAQATTNTPANLTYSRTVTPRILQDPSANAIEDNVVPSINSVELLSNGATIRTLSATTPTNVDRSIVDGTNLELRITANDNAGVHTMRFENRTDLSRGEIVYDEPLSASQSWTTNSLTIVGGLTNTVSVTVLDQSTNSVSGDYEIVVNGVLEPPPPLDAADMFLNQWCTNAPGQVTIGLRNNDPNHLPYNYYACQSALGVNCDPKANPDITRTNQNFVNQGWTNQPVGFRYCATMVPVRGGVEATTYDFLCQDFTDVLPCTVGGNEWNINFNPTVATVNLVQQQPGSLYSVNQRPITITKANGTDAAPASITCSLSNILTGGTPIPTAITTNVRNNSQFTSTAGGANLIMKVPGNLPLGTLTVAVRCQDTGDASNYVTKNFSLYVTHNSGGTR
jgi:hypothetical protein